MKAREVEIEGAIPYPIFLDLGGCRCVVVGGGAVANRKARKLLQARAEVVVVSPETKPEIESMAVEVRRRPYEAGDLEGAHLAFAATDSREVNSAVAREAGERGIFVNVADKPSRGELRVALDVEEGRATGRGLDRRGFPHPGARRTRRD